MSTLHDGQLCVLQNEVIIESAFIAKIILPKGTYGKVSSAPAGPAPSDEAEVDFTIGNAPMNSLIIRVKDAQRRFKGV